MKSNTLKNRVSYYFRFTFLFLITALIIYAPFLLTKKSFVWEHDSYTQHLKAMIFISRWYRQVLRALVHLDFKAISTYSFSIGYGSDALSTLAYYGVGDPFYVLSALVPARYIYIFYCLLIPVKNYMSGLAMSALCRRRWPSGKNDGGCIAGSLIYTFCGFALITCFGQPIFLNTLIIFPLVLIGIEKVRDGEKPWLFIISICLATVSNFYFVLSIVLMAVIYALFRYFPIAKGEFGRRFAEIGTMFAAGTVGVAMGGAILLPMALTVFGNKRVALNPTINLFYDSYSCRMLPLNFLACDEVEYGSLCYAGTALLCVILLFNTKGLIKQRIQFLLYSLLLFIPAFGYLTNGFSYPINRWCWAYSALVAMLTAEMWPRLFTLTLKQKKALAIGFTLYFVLCFCLSYRLEFNFLAPVIVTLITLVFLFLSQKEQFVPAKDGEIEDPQAARRRRARNRRAQRGILLLTIAGICTNGICENDPRFNDRISSYKEYTCLASFRTGLGASPANDLNMWLNDSSQIASTIDYDGTSFVRVSNTEPGYWYQNTSMLSGLSSTQSFWSVNSPYVLDYLDSLAVSDVNNNAWQFTNLDNRAILNELASVSYLYCMHPEKLPTGYGKDSLDPDTANSVFPNLNPLSLGYTYDRTVSREQFETLSAAEKQELLLTHAVTETEGSLEDSRSIEELAGTLECKKIPFESESLSEFVVRTDDNTFVVTESGAQVMLTFDKITSGELYIYMKNIQYLETNRLNLYSDDPAYDANDLYTSEMFDALTPYEKYVIYRNIYVDFPVTSVKIGADFYSGDDIVNYNEVNYIVPDDEQFYSGRQDFLLNSYTVGEDGIDSIVITFPVKGVYHFDEFSLISEPLTTYQDKAAQLGAESLENVQIGQNKSSFMSTGVTGEITVSDNKLLCMTVPYSTGWKAYVDGTPAVLENVNIMFSGLYLTPGHHTIELRYETPGLLYGLCITAAGLLLFLFWLIMSHRSGKKRPKKPVEVFSAEQLEEDIPAGEAAAEGTPAGDVPSQENPAEDVSAEEIPTGDAPAVETPAGEVPVDSVPAGEVSPAGEEHPADRRSDEGAQAGEEPPIDEPADRNSSPQNI